MCYTVTLYFGGGGGGGAEGLREVCVKIVLIVSCLEWLTCIFLFIMVEFKLLYSPDLKSGTHFSGYKSLPKGYNVQMSSCFTLT